MLQAKALQSALNKMAPHVAVTIALCTLALAANSPAAGEAPADKQASADPLPAECGTPLIPVLEKAHAHTARGTPLTHTFSPPGPQNRFHRPEWCGSLDCPRYRVLERAKGYEERCYEKCETVWERLRLPDPSICMGAVRGQWVHATQNSLERQT